MCMLFVKQPHHGLLNSDGSPIPCLLHTMRHLTDLRLRQRRAWCLTHHARVSSYVNVKWIRSYRCEHCVKLLVLAVNAAIVLINNSVTESRRRLICKEHYTSFLLRQFFKNNQFIKNIYIYINITTVYSRGVILMIHWLSTPGSYFDSNTNPKPCARTLQPSVKKYHLHLKAAYEPTLSIYILRAHVDS